VSVDYSLTPKSESQTQLEETLTVFKRAQQHAALLGGDSAKFFTIEGSAGAAIALQVANRLVSDLSTRANIKGLAAIMSAVLHVEHVPEELGADYSSRTENAEGVPLLDGETLRICSVHFGAQPDDAESGSVSQTRSHIFHQSSSLLPKSTLSTMMRRLCRVC
jgi:acetyl esterase/lipase